MTSLTPARVRVAPSPTGDPHVGTAYMSLFNLAYARQTGGQFILRIEDTDRARYVATSERQIFDTLAWLGLPWDEGPDIGGPVGPYRQSERLDTYRPFVDQLIASGHAYYCWCSPERLAAMRAEQEAAKLPVTGYDRACHGLTREERAALPGFAETPVVRMYIPERAEWTFTDVIRGEISAPRPDDQVILKADGFPTYHLAVVVDDHLMGITHVVRGEEWISSTPKHVLLYDWLGWTAPVWCHMPLLRNPDKSKISKRKNPAARLLWFQEQGYLPEALRNFLQLMGYPPVVDDEEVCSFDDFVAGFDWARVNTVGPVFDIKKLDWLNGHYIRSLGEDELARRIGEYIEAYQAEDVPGGAGLDEQARTVVRAAVPLIAPRLTRLGEALDKVRFLLVADEDLTVDPESWAKVAADAVTVLPAAIEVLGSLGDFTTEAMYEALTARLVDGLGLKKKTAFAPLRVAITGALVSPPLFESMEILGRAACLTRLAALAQ
ncbi:MAG: glutamate--tRNA ligase [Propionibacteriaceae bacterium]|jgi:glutamyl-tRNA synthetase|nr:glutamate--tRNA ligase [Propionibacteriaceae bacterium]